MKAILKRTLLFLALLLKVKANFLQGIFSFVDDDFEEQQDRNLGWNFADLALEDDKFFGEYDSHEIPENKTKPGDRIDFLRDGDVCVGSDGSLSRDNCLEPPDCSISNEFVGEAMLCINRAPKPGNTTEWYVVAMKCIPVWENCDKCFCGYMKRSQEMDGFCRWDESTANDDRIEYDCDDRTKVEMMGHELIFEQFLSENHDWKEDEDDWEESEDDWMKHEDDWEDSEDDWNEEDDWDYDDWEESEDDWEEHDDWHDDDERRQRRNLDGKISKGDGLRRRRHEETMS